MNTHLYVFNPPAPVSSLMSSKICVFLIIILTHSYLFAPTIPIFILQSPFNIPLVRMCF